MSTLNEFRQQLLHGGHRQNRYRATVNFPTRTLENAPKAQDSFQFLCFSTSVPTQALGEIPVKYKGRTVYFAGDPAEPETWTCSVYNTVSFDIREACIAWRNNYISPANVTGENLIDTTDVILELLDKNDNTLRKITLYNAWPVSIGSLGLGWNEENTISTFELQLRYDYPDEVSVNSNSSATTTIEG